MPDETRSARRSVSTCRGIAVCARIWSKRRTPLKTSRSTRNAHRSPSTVIARPTTQFSVDHRSAGGSCASALMPGRLSLIDRLSNLCEAAGMRTRTFSWADPGDVDFAQLIEMTGLEQLQDMVDGHFPRPPIM